MKIVADVDIPFLKGVFEPYAQVVYEKGGAIGPGMIRDADALIIRTRTKCNAQLLEDSQVRLIASATIGKDHVDTDYCRSRGIKFINAAGCNAGGVMQYVFTALFALAEKKGMHLHFGKSGRAGIKAADEEGKEPGAEQAKRTDSGSEAGTVIGVIGVGNVGSKVADTAGYLGFEVLRNDPPKEREQEQDLQSGRLTPAEAVRYCSLDELLRRSDIVTLHVPLDRTTVSMADGSFFSRMKPGAVFINSSRGEIVDETALSEYRNRLSGLILDVWRNEPCISRELLAAADLATPHIAGYSYEGKLNGTSMTVRGAAEFLNIGPLKNFSIVPDTPNLNRLDLTGCLQPEIYKTLTGIFPIFELDKILRTRPQDFERIRSNYKYRREFYVDTSRNQTIAAAGDFGGSPGSAAEKF